VWINTPYDGTEGVGEDGIVKLITGTSPWRLLASLVSKLAKRRDGPGAEGLDGSSLRQTSTRKRDRLRGSGGGLGDRA
jgi:hypothetical protein